MTLTEVTTYPVPHSNWEMVAHSRPCVGQSNFSRRSTGATQQARFATQLLLSTMSALSFADDFGEMLVCFSSTRVPLQGLRSG
jgi:hypothetical protein